MAQIKVGDHFFPCSLTILEVNQLLFFYFHFCPRSVLLRFTDGQRCPFVGEGAALAIE